MSAASERLEALRREGESCRESLAAAVGEVRDEIAVKRARWKAASLIAGGLAAAGAIAFRVFGRNSPAAQIGRLTSAASLIFGLGRAVGRLRRIF